MYLSSALQEVPQSSTAHLTCEAISDQKASERILRRHEELFCQSDDVDYVYEVVEGVFCNYHILPDGRRQVISFAYPGDLIGFGHTDGYRYFSEAISDARVRVISSTKLMRQAEGDAKIAHRLLNIAMSEITHIQNHQVMLGRKSAIEKIASFLLEMAQRNPGKNPRHPRFQLSMTRTDIADFLGLTIETVSRNLTKIKIKGVIDMPQSSTVIVRDMDMLMELAEGDEANF